MSIIDLANQIIDSNAKQLLPFLQFDKKSSSFLINDILIENDFNEKLSKLLHLLIDTIKNQSIKSNDFFDELISDLILYYPSIPKNYNDLSNWIKQKLIESSENNKKYQEAEIYFQKKIKKCQNNLQIAKKLVDAYEMGQISYHNENFHAKNLLKKEYEFDNSSTQQIASLKSFSKEKYQNKDEYIQEQKVKISSLKQKVNILQNKIAEKKSMIKALKAKISNDSNEILEVKKQNEELFSTNQHSYQATQIKNDKIEELTQINQKLKDKIKKQKAKIILLRDQGNAKIAKYKKKIEEQKKKIECDNKEINDFKSIQYENRYFENPSQNENNDLIEKCEKLTKQLEKSKKIIHKYEVEKEIADINNSKQIQSNDKSSIENTSLFKPNINEKEIENENHQSLIECNGCDFDVEMLKGKFDNLENSIDKLRSTLLKPEKTDID